MPEIDSGTIETGTARDLAFRILLRVDSGRAYSSILLARLPGHLLDPREVRLITELVYGSLRWRSRVDFFLDRVSRRPVAGLDPGLRTALRLAAYQILFLDRIPPSAAVSASVDLARGAGGVRWARFANGVLRNLCRQRAGIRLPAEESDSPEDLEVRYSHPAWLINRWIERFGIPETRILLAANNRPAPVTLRVHTGNIDAKTLRSRLASQGVETEPSPILQDSLRVIRGNPFRTSSYEDGWFYAQDEASQIVPMLFGESDSRPLLDLCAAPGGKALQLASRHADRTVVFAIDRHLGRMRKLVRNRDRLGVMNLFPMVSDTRRSCIAGARFPRVLLDAPCSGTGTLRRHPEIRWRLKASDLPRLAALQAELLEAAALHLKPGGTLVYSVCSLEPEEGRDRIRAFLETHGDFQVRDVRGLLPEKILELATDDDYLGTVPHRGEMDGFFAARLDRRNC